MNNGQVVKNKRRVESKGLNERWHVKVQGP